MVSIKIRFSALAVILAFSACSSSQSGNNSQGGGTAASPAQAVQMLSSQDRASLTRWESQLAKSCDATVIFAGQAPGAPLLDAVQLLAKTGQSVILHGPQGQFAVLGQFTTPDEGTTETQYNSSVQNGSNNYNLNAKTEYSNGECDVYVYGQKVFSTTLLSQVGIVASYSPSALPTKAFVTSPQSGSYANTSVGELDQTGYAGAIQTALTPTSDALTLVANSLAIGAEETKSFFSLAPGSLSGLMTFDHLPSIAPFSISGAGISSAILGSSSDIAALSSATAQVQSLTAVIPLQLGAIANSSDLPLMLYRVGIQTKADSGAVDYSVVSLSTLESQNDDDQQAIACFSKRLNLLNSAQAQGSSPFLPAYDDVVGACGLWTSNFSNALLNSSDAISILDKKFQGVQGSTTNDYAGWDRPLKSAVETLFAAGKDIKAHLDPQGESPVVDQMALHAETVASRLAVDADLANANVIANLVEMTSDWALSGQATSEEFVGQVLDTLNNAINPFVQSASTLISDLASNPLSDENTASLQFAQSINADYKNAANAMVAAAASLDVGDFVSAKFDAVIQQRYTVAQFLTWTSELNAAKNFAARDTARATSNDPFFSTHLKAVLDRGLAEGWSDATYEALETIAPIAKYSNFCGTMGSSISSLASCEDDFSYYSTAPGKFMDPLYGDRYSQASVHFQGYLQKLSDNSFFSEQTDLIGAFFEPLWISCGNADFAARLAGLDSLIGQFMIGDTLQNMQLDEQLRTALQDCTTP